ncbi:MAG TPA: hypothetical protein PKJ77_08860, partial [Thermodesulfobacteriota bacterium]|nr:hypothetical protein [Thermodesulfobacteriota bacterium]HOC39375.1 hypothetical protein [Thermodesulfobacteriota bacterium]
RLIEAETLYCHSRAGGNPVLWTVSTSTGASLAAKELLFDSLDNGSASLPGFPPARVAHQLFIHRTK